ncbi:FAD dependent oxidoreductase family protein [Candidatus Endolissoclinum faulkneri L2]|uniref:FAD dependent oxidoreductase family protein n=1 Tax=Candidatus Endolissoclinum faulkneri L2 TaxID=1193729 RepID=K7YPK2_9PROT|nr:FAD-binding oxidoreductase [Candidatus Endolissoclinum faulkneri]AFX99432.1 FAD dependent oxidoreductase family protein [Candidatus Endolissoclinum faulkneri L2]
MPSMTWYHDTANISKRHRLNDDLHCDVCVIGGGLTGISTALNCAERGMDVVLLESETIGFGASGRSGGQVVQGFAADISVIEQYVGKESGYTFFQMAREAVDDLKERTARHAPEADLRMGYLHLTLNNRQFKAMQSLCAAWHGWGYTGPKMITRSEVRDWLGSDRYFGGMIDPESGQIHPLRYLLGLAKGAEEAGAILFEDSAVRKVDGTIVQTDSGLVNAKYIVYCCNAYLGKLERKLYSKIMPVASFISVTEQLSASLAATIFPRDVAVADCNLALDYFRLTHDRRLLFGSGASYSTIVPPGLIGTMKRKIVRIFPEMANIRIDYQWGGLIGITINRIPDIGRLSNNTFYAQGFSGHGIVLTGFAGKIIAEAITANDKRLKLFEKIHHQTFPGGWLRTPALIAGMSWVKLREWLNI